MYLEVTVGSQRPVTYRLSRPELAVGSLLTNEIVVTSPSISKKHLKLIFQEDCWYAMDLESTNGTYMEEEMLLAGIPSELKILSELRLGEDVFLRLVERPNTARVLELPSSEGGSEELANQEKTVRLSLDEFKAAQDRAVERKRQLLKKKEKFFVWDTKVLTKIGMIVAMVVLLAFVLDRTWRSSGNMARDEFIHLPKGDALWDRGPAHQSK